VEDTLRRGVAEGAFYEIDPRMGAVMVVALLQSQLAWLLEHEVAADAKALSEAIVVQLRRLLSSR
jgi:hypothetical protein